MIYWPKSQVVATEKERKYNCRSLEEANSVQKKLFAVTTNRYNLETEKIDRERGLASVLALKQRKV